jgi:hypothetical protein
LPGQVRYNRTFPARHSEGGRYAIQGPSDRRDSSGVRGIAAVGACRRIASARDRASVRRLDRAAEPEPGISNAERYALAVGSYLMGNQTRALAERWTGSGWSLVPAASPAADYNGLQAVAATGSDNAWAVGTRRAAPGSAFRTLTEHRNGSSWTALASPNAGHGDNWLYGVAALPNGGGFWAVGTDGNNTLTEFRC